MRGRVLDRQTAAPAPVIPANGSETAAFFRDAHSDQPIAAAAAVPAEDYAAAFERQETRHPSLCPYSLAQLRLDSYVALLLIDMLSIACGFLLANLVRFDQPFATAGVQYTVEFGAVFLAIAFSSGAYAVDVLEQPRNGIARVLKAVALTAAALLLGFFYMKTSAVMSRAVLGVGVVAASALMVTGRYLFGVHIGNRHGWKFQNEVLLVDGTAVEAPFGTVLYAESAGLNPYENDPTLADRVGAMLDGADRIILACSADRRAAWLRLLKGVGVDVEVLAPELDRLGALALRKTDNGAAVLVAAGPLGLRDTIVKRTLDLTLAILLLALLAPLMLLTAAAIKATSGGPVFFRQRRIGRGNHPFEVFKFRTMHIHACDQKGAVSASRNDERVTTIGAVLRHTSLDELPQLFNVLRGEMSIVGPRPHAPGSTAENALFWNIDERYWQRGAVKPGITGLAQIRGFRGATGTRQDLTNRVQSDLEYLANWTVWKDIAIIFRTIRVVIHPNAF
jgi:exopolysaccharide biosynthesis polyprenyl glycosylphosphotransferase